MPLVITVNVADSSFESMKQYISLRNNGLLVKFANGETEMT
jgi:hypothetical protein